MLAILHTLCARCSLVAQMCGTCCIVNAELGLAKRRSRVFVTDDSPEPKGSLPTDFVQLFLECKPIKRGYREVKKQTDPSIK